MNDDENKLSEKFRYGKYQEKNYQSSNQVDEDEQKEIDKISKKSSLTFYKNLILLRKDAPYIIAKKGSIKTFLPILFLGIAFLLIFRIVIDQKVKIVGNYADNFQILLNEWLNNRFFVIFASEMVFLLIIPLFIGIYSFLYSSKFDLAFIYNLFVHSYMFYIIFYLLPKLIIMYYFIPNITFTANVATTRTDEEVIPTFIFSFDVQRTVLTLIKFISLFFMSLTISRGIYLRNDKIFERESKTLNFDNLNLKAISTTFVIISLIIYFPMFILWILKLGTF